MDRGLKVIQFPKAAYLQNSHSQTVFSSFFPPENRLTTDFFSEDIFLETEDGTGDVLCLHHNPPAAFYKRLPVRFNGYYLVLIHGMEGTADSHYIVTMGELALRHGYGVIRVNLRGCGQGEGLSSRLYNSGTKDIDRVIRYIYYNINRNIILCGYSLSANMVLKYMGEARRDEVRFFSAVSPPLDLKIGCDYIDSEKARFYRDFFLRSYREKIKKGLIKAPKAMLDAASKAETLFDFDDFLTAPLYNYKGALDYYKDCSSLPHIPKIRHQGILIHADDDPLIPDELFRGVKWRRYPNLTVILTKGGGHVGFLCKKTKEIPDGRWLNHTLLHYFAEKTGVYEY
ncbi:MAG TPA: alpha/beta fold hydrolase [Leptospiraceae bacterium]|nr:alpha/beta fold hydrolase [Leptospiraceae bacterium]HNF26578.1 alpha/beta fold hydrolase [Leptospiraceae bacterium]HNH08681.1 alpha/beta fold hydrolase [Leptospiraceae bacterium]HNI99643.1 alpha/beta fold hydrolase [Leptospiraceae bacterium]HNM04963.1 alpha/beta fold hydrolase [Leptospiraceae bacterium]